MGRREGASRRGDRGQGVVLAGSDLASEGGERGVVGLPQRWPLFRALTEMIMTAGIGTGGIQLEINCRFQLMPTNKIRHSFFFCMLEFFVGWNVIMFRKSTLL